MANDQEEARSSAHQKCSQHLLQGRRRDVAVQLDAMGRDFSGNLDLPLASLWSLVAKVLFFQPSHMH